MIKVFKFDGVLTESDWLTPAWVSVSADGCVQNVTDLPPKVTDNNPLAKVERVRGYAIPGFQNAHSHAFQYAMAGHAEHLPLGAGQDDFWSWRDAMYRLALSISPEQLESIATMLYAEMLRHGYTSVAEFHYLHHDTDGTPYDDLALMGKHLIQAAETAGIRITLLPIFYQMGGFGKRAEGHQRRFLSSDISSYFRLFEATKEAVTASPTARLGLGVHSMRAVTSEDLIEAYDQVPSDMPRHIHVSEQQKEVDACLAFTGQRPVQWLLEHLDMSAQDHLVHATHIDASEISGLAACQANVVLCPSTEGNLGDGLFPLVPYIQAKGRWSIGTDSHIGLQPFEELRLLDYGQRLHHQKRNVLCQKEGDDSGMIAFQEALLSGRAAMGSGASRDSFFAVGEPFDALVLDAGVPLLSISPKERLLSTMLYALDSHALFGTIVNGEWVVKDGHHRKEEAIRRTFRKCLASLPNG